MLAAILVAATIAAWILVDDGDRSGVRMPSVLQQTALDWVLEGMRSGGATPGAQASRYRGPFPDQGMPEDPRPHYVVFEHGMPETFYVVFVESGEMYTASYRFSGHGPAPRLVDFRYGYGWFDLSEPRTRPLEVWALEAGGQWVWYPPGRAISPLIGPSFVVERYDVSPDSRNHRRMYVNGFGPNIGDAAGSAECYLLYGSQAALIEGPYLDRQVSPWGSLSVAGDVIFPKRLDDWESGGVECRSPERAALRFLEGW